jgi:hypothetical protein
MDVVSGENKNTMVRINRCRIYLQATTTSDIANADGTHITDFAWGMPDNDGKEKLNPRKSKQEWPRQTRPGPKSWTAWRNALKKHLSIDGKSTRLRAALGKWTKTPEQSRQR